MSRATAPASILYHCEGDDGRMLEALRAALPARGIRRWPEPGDPRAITDAIVWLPPPDFFDGLVSLERVHALAAGIDQLLAHPGLPARATLIRLEDAGMGERMAEYVLHGVLHAHRRFPELAAARRARRWAHELQADEAAEFGVGVLGAGALGRVVMRRLVANGYPVGCWSRTPRTLPEGVAGHVGARGLDDCLAAARALVCLLPLTDATRGILDRALFERLPRGAFLINPGRGGHLVEEDLLAALDAGHLCGAQLDVFAEEPLPPEHPFWDDPRLLLTPHVAAPSPVAGSVAQVASSFAAIVRGERPAGTVDRARGY